MSQNHFTLAFPLKSPAAAKALAEQLPPMMPTLFQAADAIGTIHYSRFTVLSERTLLFLGDFDGEFSQLMVDLAKRAGPVFDAIFKQVDNPPPTPVASNADAFVEWMSEHLLDAVNLYTAYPGVTAGQIKAMAAAADVTGAAEQRPFLVILPIKSRLAFFEIKLLLRARGRGTTKDLDKVGTPHFAQFVPLEDNQIGFFTVYDGTFETYIADFICHTAELVIELDGGQHFSDQAEQADAARTAVIESRGLKVLRFSNHDVMTNRVGVLEKIATAVAARAPTPALPRKREREDERMPAGKQSS